MTSALVLLFSWAVALTSVAVALSETAVLDTVSESPKFHFESAQHPPQQSDSGELKKDNFVQNDTFLQLQ